MSVRFSNSVGVYQKPFLGQNALGLFEQVEFLLNKIFIASANLRADGLVYRSMVISLQLHCM
jgi:hypothetical protein